MAGPLVRSQLRPTLGVSMVPPSVVYAVAVEAQCSPPTVRRYLTGEKVQPSIAARIASALACMGLSHLPCVPKAPLVGQGEPMAGPPEAA